MKTYNFRIVVEPDGERWHAYCPALVGQGGATWGHTQQEALKNIQEVVQMVVESLMEHGQALPTEPADQVQVSGETFEIKTLRTMIELQAHWTDDDLKRLRLIR